MVNTYSSVNNFPQFGTKINCLYFPVITFFVEMFENVIFYQEIFIDILSYLSQKHFPDNCKTGRQL